MFGQDGVHQSTDGYNYIAKDDDVWVYTGVTSATSDNSIIGFVLINQRTAEAKYYSIAGATEESAMNSAEGVVQDLGYEATFPLLLNISGQPTYFMALKDGAGLVKQFAMVNIVSYQYVATGTTVAECQKAYKSLMASNGEVDAASASDSETVTGVIHHISSAVVDGNSHYHVRLDGNDMLYDFALPGLTQIAGYRDGDNITFTCIKGDSISTALSIDQPAKQEEMTNTEPSAA